MTTYPLCDNLELRPLEEDRNHLGSILYEINAENLTQEDAEEYLQALVGSPPGRYFAPYCKKLNQPCIVLESGVMSLQHTGRFDQQFSDTLANSHRIRECSDGEGISEVILPVTFLRAHIKVD